MVAVLGDSPRRQAASLEHCPEFRRIVPNILTHHMDMLQHL